MAGFNLFALRRLYNPSHRGRGNQGQVRRKEFKITILPTAYLALQTKVPLGAGRYGSPVMELALHMLLASVGSMDVQHVAEEMALAITPRDELVQNLAELAMRIRDYQPVTPEAKEIANASE